MSGVCAGNPADTAPGDVIIAAPAWEYDEGKHDADGFRPDPRQFPLDTRWLRAAQDFDPSGLPSHGVASDEDAAVWFLERLSKGQDPRTHPARRRYFPPKTWGERLDRLKSDGLIAWRDGRWALTGVGLDHIQRKLYDDVDGPDRLPFAVLTGPMASGSAVQANTKIWDELGKQQRKILAVEMEAATIATVAHTLRVAHWLVVKGVMDHADFEKDDRFKSFAATASAEVLLALLGELLQPAATSPRPAKPVGGIPGTVKLEIVRRLTYDWQDLADVVGVPAYEMRRFRAGDEPRDLWAWLENRDRLGDLPGALDEIGRSDLAGLLRPYTE
jgi:nucleoside phosphorylase